MLSSLKNKFQGCLIASYLITEVEEKSQNKDNTHQLVTQIIKSIINRENLVEKITLFQENKLIQNDEEWAIILLPLILFEHDRPTALLREINLIADQIKINSSTRENLRIWTKAIALICQKQTTPDNFINQILINEQNLENKLTKQLQIIQESQQQRKSLQHLFKELTKHKCLENSTIPLALYYFSCSPEDINLTLQRAKNNSHDNQKNLLKLIGVLLGLNHGYQSLIKQWPTQIKNHIITKEIEILTEKLFITWCGVYQINENDLFTLNKVSPINLIQPRNWPKEYDENF